MGLLAVRGLYGQDPTQCTGSKDSDGLTFEDNGGTGVFSGTVTTACGPLSSATSSVPWVTITSASNFAIQFSVSPNTTPSARPGSVTAIFGTAPGGPVSFTFSLTQFAKLTFTNTSLPVGVVGLSYSAKLQVAGGSNFSRSFSLPSGSLPDGLFLTGQTIGGTPTASGTASFSAQVRDVDPSSGNPFFATQEYGLTINPRFTLATTSLPEGTAGTAYSAPIVANGGIPAYKWSLISGTLPQTLSLDPNTGVIGGSLSVNAQGTYPLTIQVTDQANESLTASLSLHVAPPPLTIATSALSQAAEGALYGATLAANGGTPPYSWSATGLPAWLHLSSGGQFSGTPPAGSAGSYSFTVSLQDANSQSISTPLSLQVNAAPLTIANGSPLPEGKEGSAYHAGFQASGGKGPYTWAATGLPAFLKLSASGSLSGTPPTGSAGLYGFTVNVSDASGSKAGGTFSLNVNPLSSPEPLAIATASLPSTAERSAFGFKLAANGGTPPYSWSATGLPAWLHLSSAGQLSGTPPPGSAGSYSFTVSLQDANSQSTSAPLSLQVNAAPLTIVNVSPLLQGKEGSAYHTVFIASGGKGLYTWTATGLPAFLNLSASGSLSGTPPTGSAGLYSFAVNVGDASENKASGTFSLKVNSLSSPEPLTVAPPLLPSAAEGSAYGFRLAASGGTPPYSWSATGLPAWLHLSSAGQLSGTPPAASAGSYSFTAKLKDANSDSATIALSLRVSAVTVSIVTTATLPSAQESGAYSASFQATGGTGPYKWSGSRLPAFLSLSAGGVLSGTPPAGSAGSYSFTVSVTDALGVQASGVFSVKVDPLSSIIITVTPPLLQAIEGQLYSVKFSASGGTAPYAWSVAGLPGWASFSSDGVLSGTPPIGAAGGSQFTVTAKDAANNIQSKHVVFVVLAAGGGLTITSPSPLPDAAAGIDYQFTLDATGGTPPYKWSGSGIPEGLTLAPGGRLSGTPTSAGDAIITVQATDANQHLAFAALSLHVAPAPLSIATGRPLPAGEVSVHYFTIFHSNGGTRPQQWSLVSGPLPSGLTLDANGVLSGIPSESGVFPFTVGVTEVDAAKGSPLQAAKRSAHAAAANPVTATAEYEIVVRPYVTPDLVISCGSLWFETPVVQDAPLQTCSLISSTYSSIPFSVSVDASWLLVSTSGITPGRIDVSVNSSGLADGDYTATITVSSPGLAPKTIPVFFTMQHASGILQVSPSSLSVFNAGGQPFSASLFVQNAGQADLPFTVSVDVPWLQVDPASGTLPAGAVLPIQATGLAPDSTGPYLGTIEIESPSGTVQIPTSLLVSNRPKMILSRDGILLRARKGNGVSGPSPATFLVWSSTPAEIHYTARLVGGEGWLSMVGDLSGVASDTLPGKVSFQARSVGLETGVYYALISVTAPEPFNSLAEFLVVLEVQDGSKAPVPDPDPNGLVLAAAGGPEPRSQPVTVYTSSDLPVAYQVAVQTEDGGDWLSAAPASGMLSTGTPAQLALSANAASLPPGIYRGGVNISISNLEVRTVNVTLIVPASGSTSHRVPGAMSAHATGCSPSSLVLTETGLPGNFSTPAAWPSFLAVQLADDCGNPVLKADVVAEFSNGDPSLALKLTGSTMAVYSATWTPVHPVSQLTISMQATALGLKTASTVVLGAVSSTPYPILKQNSTVHNLYPRAGAPLAPGTIVAIYGSGFAAAPVSATGALPTMLGDTSVVIGGELAPLYYTSANQINAQLPADLVPGQEYQVLVLTGGAYSTPDRIRIAPATPGVARLANGQVIAQHQDFSQVTPDSPAKPGEYLVIYLAGMGLTDTPVAAGALSPSSPLASVSVPASLTLDGKPVPVLFAGLSPGFVGLYQINFQVPAGERSGSLELQILQKGMAANTSVLVVVAK